MTLEIQGREEKGEEGEGVGNASGTPEALCIGDTKRKEKN